MIALEASFSLSAVGQIGLILFLLGLAIAAIALLFIVVIGLLRIFAKNPPELDSMVRSLKAFAIGALMVMVGMGICAAVD